MIQDDYLRLQKNLPTTPPPPKGFVDLRYSPASSSLVTVSEDGTEAPVGSGSGSSAAKSVANAAARLALSLEAAQGFAVVDADTGKTWMLVESGTPSVSGDWLQLGDRDITAADIADPENIPGIGASEPLSLLFPSELARHQTVSTVNQQLTLWTLGDSMMSSTRLPLGLGWLLQQKVPVIGYALEEINTSTVSGTVTAPPSNATGSELTNLWDSGKVWQLATGAIVKAHNLNGGTVGLLSSKANFYCSKQSGGGTATIEYSRDGSTWVSLGTLDTNGTAGEIARAALTPAAGLGHYQYRITATGGPVNYIGCKVWDDTRSGVILCNSNMGGLRVSDMLEAPAAVRNTIAADMGKVLLVTQFREGDGELTETILNNFLDAWETAIPNGEIILIDQIDTPSLANNTATAGVNALYSAASAARPTVRNYHINDVCGTEDQRDHAGFFNASTKGTVTVNTTTNVLTCSAAHGFGVGTEVTFSTTGTLPAPLVAWDRVTAQRYFVKTIPTTTTFTLALTDGGSEIDITDSGSGTHSVTQTDTIHHADDFWRYIGADFVHKLTNYSEGSQGASIFRDGSGNREAIFGNTADEFAPVSWLFRVPRLAKQRWAMVSKSNLGALTRFGWNWQLPSATFADGVLLELANDGGYKTPLTIDGTGYLYAGPYNATTQSGYTIGARLAVEEDANGKSVVSAYHKGTPTVPILRAGVNSAGTRTDKFQTWADGKVSQFPPASATPSTNGELVIEATSNTTLTFKLKGSDGTVRTGTITLAP